MPSCTLMDSCYFYQHELSGMPCTYKDLLYKYCLGDYTRCARFRYAQAYGTYSVPPDMFPNDNVDTLAPVPRLKAS